MLKRRVLITGAGSGLGRGLSICLAQEGHSIMATDINLEGAQETVSQIKASGAEAEAYCLDVTSEQYFGLTPSPIEAQPTMILMEQPSAQQS